MSVNRANHQPRGKGCALRRQDKFRERTNERVHAAEITKRFASIFGEVCPITVTTTEQAYKYIDDVIDGVLSNSPSHAVAAAIDLCEVDPPMTTFLSTFESECIDHPDVTVRFASEQISGHEDWMQVEDLSSVVHVHSVAFSTTEKGYLQTAHPTMECVYSDSVIQPCSTSRQLLCKSDRTPDTQCNFVKSYRNSVNDCKQSYSTLNYALAAEIYEKLPVLVIEKIESHLTCREKLLLSLSDSIPRQACSQAKFLTRNRDLTYAEGLLAGVGVRRSCVCSSILFRQPSIWKVRMFRMSLRGVKDNVRIRRPLIEVRRGNVDICGELKHVIPPHELASRFDSGRVYTSSRVVRPIPVLDTG